MEVVKEFFLQNILYLKNFVKQLDIEQANSVRMINNIARISGHNPSRGISAKGTLKFKLKQGINIDQLVSNGQVVIYNKTVIKNTSNNLYYSLKIGTDKNFYQLTPGCQFFVNVVQGRYESQQFTGDGTISQSFQASVSNNGTIDNFDFNITLNGTNLNITDHLYDMLQDEYACYTRTGFNGGLDIYFGNGINGIIPPIGSIISVTYLMNNGLQGNILNNKVNDFLFVDNIYDSAGNILQVSQLFDLFVETDIKFASDGESVDYTKSIISYVSRNFVLATPPQFIYHLKKLNMFSKVNAFNDLDTITVDINNDGNLDNININQMFLYLIPRITDHFSTNVNYFNVPFSAFYLNQNDKDRIISYLKNEGIVSITTVIKIIDPTIQYFIINIFIRRYDDVSEENIRENITSILSSYFADYSRYDRIVKADLLTQLKAIDGVDSINLEFVGKANEDYHRDGALLTSTKQSVSQSTYAASTSSVNISSTQYRSTVTAQQNQNISSLDQINSNSNISIGNSTIVAYNNTKQYDSTKMLGIDPVLGDIIIGNNELVVLRGGWSNRNDIFFSEDPKTTIGFSTVNIIWKGITPRK